MNDIEERLELMQEEIELLGGVVKAQTKTINSLLEIVKSLKEYLAPDVVVPDNIIYLNPRDEG